MSDTDRDKLVSIILKNLHTNSSRIADAILAEFLPDVIEQAKADAFYEGARRQWGYGQKSIPNEYVPNPYRKAS